MLAGWFFQGVAAASTRAGAFQESHHDSLYGEASALAAALTWLLSLLVGVAVHLHFDCLCAGLGADGSCRLLTGRSGQPRAPFLLARSLFLLHQVLGRDVQVHHVRSNRGDPFNELVDRVAKAAWLVGFGCCQFRGIHR